MLLNKDIESFAIMMIVIMLFPCVLSFIMIWICCSRGLLFPLSFHSRAGFSYFFPIWWYMNLLFWGAHFRTRLWLLNSSLDIGNVSFILISLDIVSSFGKACIAIHVYWAAVIISHIAFIRCHKAILSSLILSIMYFFARFVAYYISSSASLFL